MKKLLMFLFLGLFLILIPSLVSAVFTASYEEPELAFNSGGYILRATSGGTVFTTIPYNAVVFDYFDDTSVVDDAIYFSEGRNGPLSAGLRFNVGTPISATSYTLVWEYYKRTGGWVPIEDLADDTGNFSIIGSNDVRFPQQWQPHSITINSLTSAMWVRVRLTAVSGLTEGGANQIDTVKRGSGRLYISGTTDEIPATFTEIYDWIKTNQPHISVTKRSGNSFDFTKVGLIFQSRLYTTNEIIEMGPDCHTNNKAGYNNLNYVTSGIKKDDVTGYDGSTFIVYGRANQNVINAGSQTKMYGTTIRTGKGMADTHNYAGYLTMNGEWVDCTVELSTRLPGSGSTVSNVRIVGSLLIASSLDGVYSGVNYFCTASSLFYVYRSGFTLPNFGYQFRGTTGTLFYIYQGSGTEADYTWKLQNPSTPLNTLADSVKPIKLSSSLTAISQLWYYDDSAGTYTDYTAEAVSTATGDVPLGGDVGDMYYFGMTTLASSSTGLSIYLDKTTISNDYIYKWEYYRSGAWHESHTIWDACENLGATGNLFTNANYADSISINGVSKDYLRATIVTKGTGSPVADRVQQRRCSAVNHWNLKETYSFDLKVTDKDGLEIDGVNVTATDENDVEIFSVTTAANGTIAQQETVAKHWYFDPINNPTTLISENIYATFDLKVTKVGYTDYIVNKIKLGSKIDWGIALKEQPPWDYSTPPLFLIKNKTTTGVFKISPTGDLAIAGELHENTNSPPTETIIWSIGDLIYLTSNGNLYIKGIRLW